MQINKADSKAVSYYSKPGNGKVPSYRWPKKLYENENVKNEINNLLQQAFADQEEAEMLSALDKRVSIKKPKSKNFHTNRVDMNVIYNKKKSQKAKFIEGLNKMI